MLITRGSDLLGDHGQVLLPLSQRLGVGRPPAECVEHVEEGDGDIDEDDQGKQRIFEGKNINDIFIFSPCLYLKLEDEALRRSLVEGQGWFPLAPLRSVFSLA